MDSAYHHHLHARDWLTYMCFYSAYACVLLPECDVLCCPFSSLVRSRGLRLLNRGRLLRAAARPVAPVATWLAFVRCVVGA